MLLAAQLPENPNDARMVLAAITELVETFLDQPVEQAVKIATNVLPFVSG
jgi:hypothetical protein